MQKERISFKNITTYCRWQTKYPPDNWTIIGIAERWLSPTEFQYKICLCGFELHINFNRKFL